MHSQTTTDERWAPVPSFAGYEASTLGRIRSWRPRAHQYPESVRTDPLILTPRLNKRGYLTVALSRGRQRKRKRCFVHRLVLASFAGQCPEGMECCHGQGGPADNRLTNLRWGTLRENIDERQRDHLKRETGKAKLSDEDARTIISRIADGERDDDIALDHGATRALVLRIRMMRAWTHMERPWGQVPLRRGGRFAKSGEIVGSGGRWP